MRRFPSLTRTTAEAGALRRVEIKKSKEMVVEYSPLVMVISVSLRVVLATHVYHDVTSSQFLGVSGPHNLCILQGTQEVRGLSGSHGYGFNVGLPRSRGEERGARAGHLQEDAVHPDLAAALGSVCAACTYPVLRQEAQQRARQRLIAVEGAVVCPDSGRSHEVAAGSFGR